MRYLSLFTGIGGFELGIQQAYESNFGAKSTKRNKSHVRGGKSSDRMECNTVPICIGYSEIDKYATQIYQHHYPQHQNYGDITKINEKELPDFDLLVGGFPCQSFSIAGKRRGFEDTRGTLFFDIARIIKAKRPRLLLLENVKGLLSHDEGRTFATIIGTLDELGYDIQWQLLNSKDFGVPQNRERIFIVGHLRGTRRPEVFPFGDDAEIFDSEEHAGKGRAQTEISHTLRGPNIKADQLFIREPVIVTTARGFNKGSTKRISPTMGSHSWERNNHLAFTLKARADSGMDKKHPKTLVIEIPEATKQGYALAHPGDSINLSVMGSKTRRERVGKGVAQTLDTGMQQHTLSPDMRIRRLTPVECERLQGFPDNWTEGVSDTQRYKCLGNAVTVNVIQAIIERMI